MKVLIFLPQFAFGGAERLGVELAESLNRRGIHADILCMYSDKIKGIAAVRDELLNRGIHSIHFLGMNVHPSIFSAFLAIRKIRRLIQENRYQIVETSSITPSILAACALWGLPAIHVAGIHAVFRLDRDKSTAFLVWRFLAHCRNKIRFYGVSEYAVEHWGIYSGVARNRIRRISNSINSAFYKEAQDRPNIRRNLGIPDDACVVVSVGRLVSSKGVDVLYEALMPILVEKNIFLLYVGSVDKSEACGGEVREKIKEKVKEQGLLSRVAFVGHQKDIAPIMNAADLLAHPVGREAFGLVLVEAMAVGIPVVASNVEGIPEVLAGTDSVMVEPNDPAALRNALLSVLGRTSDQAKRAIAKGKLRAQDFRAEKRADAMVALFEDVLSGRF